MRTVRAANNIDKDRLAVIPTADDSRSNSTVGAGGDSSAFVVAPVEGIEEDRFLSVMVGVVVVVVVVVVVPLVLAVVEVLVFIISATWKLALMTRL